MADESPQPSAIIFPVALQPAVFEPEVEIHQQGDKWGWLELFVLSQVFWGVLLFIPGSQAFRFYIRAFPYATSLMAVIACARSSGTNLRVPGARWIVAALLLLVANLVHEETWLTAGVGQVVFQLAIVAPVFWAARMWVTSARLERLILLIFGAHALSALLGLLQVYYPSIFLPPEFSSLAQVFDKDFVQSLTYLGAGERAIIRPPGLSDLPGGAAISGTITALLGFALAVRPNQKKWINGLFFLAVFIGLTTVYLTQVRSMLLMILGGMILLAFVRLRQGRVAQSTWVAMSAAVLIIGSFAWAVTLGGDVVSERYRGIYDSGVVRTYQDNRGVFLS